MSLLTKLFKRNQNTQIQEQDPNKNEDMELVPIESVIKEKEPITKRYPDGLPLDILELISFNKFGAMLKQNDLLPPSYDKNPINVEIDKRFGKPRVILTFKSKTSDSSRLVSIFGYNVSYEKTINQPLTVLECNYLMAEQWLQFAEELMNDWEHGNRFKYFDTPSRVRIGEHLMKDDKDYADSINKIVQNNKNAIEKELNQ